MSRVRPLIQFWSFTPYPSASLCIKIKSRIGDLPLRQLWLRWCEQFQGFRICPLQIIHQPDQRMLRRERIAEGLNSFE
jgi:hypothetical protein